MGGNGSTSANEQGAGDTAGYAPPKDTVVDTEKVAAKKGDISVKGRYCTTRPLSADYTIETKVLGSGMSGPVQLAVGKADKRKYAVKSFKKKGLTPRRRNELKNEVEIYLALDHPHVARLEMVFETETEVFIVMEFMAGGELYDRLAEQKRYTEKVASTTTHQMLMAVAYMHEHKLAHRDLKLENFLYESKETDHLKLIDFGFAKFREGNTKMEQACGSVHYVAPEVLAHSYTEKADCWSLGIIVYMLLTGSPPFSGADDDVLRKIKACKPNFSSRFGRLSEEAQDFVKKLLVGDPEKRMSAAQALDHKFIVDHKDKGSNSKDNEIDADTLKSLRSFAHATHFRRATYAMMAWSLTAEHRAELRSRFLALDVEKTGTIKHKAFKEILETNFHIDNEEAETLFKSLDTDNDDEIAYSEFLAAIMHDRLSMHEDVLRKTFSRFDDDQSGKISKEDLKKVLGDKFEGAELEELIKEADIDHDGLVSYDEFLAFFQKEENITPRNRKMTEKLSAVMDDLLPDHADPESPTVHAAKTPMMRVKEGSPMSSYGDQHTPTGETPKS